MRTASVKIKIKDYATSNAVAYIKDGFRSGWTIVCFRFNSFQFYMLLDLARKPGGKSKRALYSRLGVIGNFV